MTTFATRLDPEHNSLNALRLALAGLVVVSHAPLVAGQGEPYRWADLEVGGWAVAGFFAISGWLITGSRLNLDLAPFLWRRCLRIFPAFWMVLVVTAVVFAPLSTLAEGNLDLASDMTYVLANAGLWVFQGGVADTLPGSALHTWNLSLWTLVWEALCYLGIGVLLVSTAVRRTRGVVLPLLLVLATVTNVATDAIGASSLEAVARLGSFFLAGAVIKVYAHRLPANGWLAAASAVALAGLWQVGMVGAFGAMPLAYLSLYAGAVLPLTRIGRRNDISYGVYIYAFPVQQLLALAGGLSLGMPLFIVVSLVAVTPLAWASWLWVERPAMRLKTMLPGRQVAR